MSVKQFADFLNIADTRRIRRLEKDETSVTPQINLMLDLICKNPKYVEIFANIKTEGSEILTLTGQELQTIRKRMKLTQEQFADYFCEGAKGTVQKWERGERSINGTAVLLILAAHKSKTFFADIKNRGQ